jgi:hypothetical protein
MRSLTKTVRTIQITWAAVLSFELSGCSSQAVTLVHPGSAATAKCSASGTGLGTGWAQGFVDSCVARYKSMGYVPLDELTPQQRAEMQKQGSLPTN